MLKEAIVGHAGNGAGERMKGKKISKSSTFYHGAAGMLSHQLSQCLPKMHQGLPLSPHPS